MNIFDYLLGKKKDNIIFDDLGILCHFPIAEWSGMTHGSWHIYGHIHNNTGGAFQYMKKFDRAVNAAACINNY